MTKARLETVANGSWMTKDPFIREKFTKAQTHARQHAKEYFECYPKDRYQTVVESWRSFSLGISSLR